MMSSSSLSHILNFFSRREIVSSLVLICQPNIVGVSDKNPSSCSLPSDRQSSRLIFLFGSSGQNRIWMAKSMACSALLVLSNKSGTITIPSSMKSSTLPLSSSGTATSSSHATEQGMSGSR